MGQGSGAHTHSARAPYIGPVALHAVVDFGLVVGDDALVQVHRQLLGHALDAPQALKDRDALVVHTWAQRAGGG